LTIKNKRVAVTGGAGFIGSHIVEELYKDNEVIIIDNLSAGKLENIEPFLINRHVQFINSSITDLPLLQTTFKGVDYVFHEAAVTSVPQSINDPISTNTVNITGTLNVLIAARDNKVKKVIYASSSAVYGNNPNMPLREEYAPQPLSPYAVSKITGEYYCKIFSEIYGLSTVSLRYFNVYGPRQDPDSQYAAVIPIFIKKFQSEEAPIIYGDGNQVRDFVFVKDVVQANILLSTYGDENIYSDNCIINIGSGKITSINQVIQLLSSICGNSINPKYVSPRSGDPLYSHADITKALKLGYSPKNKFETDLETTFEYFLKES